MMNMNKIVFASRNKGKIREVISILKNINTEIQSLLDYPDMPDIEETGTTFEENARLKAYAVYNKYKIPVIADDSGISLQQLGGRPGVYSARYAGKNATDQDNNLKLIEELKTFPEPHPAKYICAAVYFDGKEFYISYGELKGQIIKSPAGIYGFGYDPYFVADGYNITMAQMDPEEKNRISHRFKAFDALEIILKNHKEIQ